MWKKQKRCLMMDSSSSLPHDVVERIMERLPVKSLGRFKGVSNQWKSTIESPVFQERQFMLRQQSGDPDVLLVSELPDMDISSDSSDTESQSDSSDDVGFIESLRNLVLGSSSSVEIYAPWDDGYSLASPNSCDGLVCLYHHERSGFVGNPITRCYRPLPVSNYQQKFILDSGRDAYFQRRIPLFKLGFGKDKVNGTYKAVWLYNSSEFGLHHATTCEVFDFTTDAWRFLTHSSPYRILATPDPAYVDGSLHWLTKGRETKVVSFDLHTETFQVLSKAPLVNPEPSDVVICNLDNRLCVSEMKGPNQVIWSFHPTNKTWDKMFSIDLSQTSHLYGIPKGGPLVPLALLDGCKTKKLLFFCFHFGRTLVIHDPETKSYDAAFTADSLGFPVCYFPSLISI